jgi:hypothetical protein
VDFPVPQFFALAEGVTSMQLAQRKRDAAVAQTAVIQIKAARDALTAGRYLSAGY